MTFPRSLPIPITQRRSLDADERVVLLPSEDGWSLVTSDGRLLHREPGHRSTRACLEFARDAGVLVIRH